MARDVIIIVPAQGENAENFQWVAKVVNRKLYGGKATIVKTTISASGEVDFKTHDGKAFSWGTTHHVSSVLTISHGMMCDGPNLAFLDSSVDYSHHQPWGRFGESATCGELSDAAKAFWTTVSKTMTSQGKIMLIGCSMGHDNYGKNVAKVTRKTVFASDSSFAAANEERVLTHVQQIEKGKVSYPMKRFHP